MERRSDLPHRKEAQAPRNISVLAHARCGGGECDIIHNALMRSRQQRQQRQPFLAVVEIAVASSLPRVACSTSRTRPAWQ